ncbi:MAG: hypothetical protein HYZ71_09675 [Deltaproteobacteria bacterium]|nr:hypothetical protein [Deltaproteobacteria bacterium]
MSSLTKPISILLFILSMPVFADWEWVTISKGTYQGFGFAKDKWTAIDRCAANMESKFIALAKSCCESQKNDTSAQFDNRCAGGYTGPKNSRSFSGGVPAYFCWPTNRIEHYPTGYYAVWGENRPWTCQELKDLSARPTPTPTPVPNDRPIASVPSPTPAPKTAQPIASPIPSLSLGR